jgi:hypothetical protein
MTQKPQHQGIASITLIIFVVIAITITTAATIALISNTTAATQVEQTYIALDIANSGIENGLVRFMRDTNYAGETLAISGGQAIVTMPDKQTLRSQGIYGNYIRTIQIKMTDYVNTNNLTINSWQELY